MDKYTLEAVNLLEKLIAIPSTSRDESAAAAKFSDFIEEKGLPLLREGNNVASVCPDFNEALPTLLLDAHIDTVKPVSGWQCDPFRPARSSIPSLTVPIQIAQLCAPVNFKTVTNQ